MRIADIWTYPVKSMVGHTVERVEVDSGGIVGDRIWAVRDLESGGIRGAKKLGGLMEMTARPLGDGHVEITLADGGVTATTEPDCNEMISQAIGRDLRLERLAPVDDLDHYRRGAPDSDDLETELRDIFGRTHAEPLPDLSVFPPEIIEFESPPGRHHDAFPLMVMTRQTLESLDAALPDSAIDVCRFRPSLVVDASDLADSDRPANGHPELGWTGRRARVGSTELAFGATCPRCVMVTRRINDSLPADRAILRHIVAELDQCVGVYATVVTPGEIAVGDEVTFV